MKQPTPEQIEAAIEHFKNEAFKKMPETIGEKRKYDSEVAAIVALRFLQKAMGERPTCMLKAMSFAGTNGSQTNAECERMKCVYEVVIDNLLREACLDKPSVNQSLTIKNNERK